MMERTEAKRKIGILGGTFNPIHNGHLQIAQQAKDYLSLDEMFLMPSGNSYMKKASEILSGEIRSEMVQLAVEEYEGMYLSKMEVNRSGATYTYETLQLLHQQYPETEFYFLVGGDSLFSISNWKNPDMIFQHWTLVVATRDDKTSDCLKQQMAMLKREFQAEIILLPEHLITISSSDIRERIKKGQSIEGLVPPKVDEYIRKNRLYE